MLKRIRDYIRRYKYNRAVSAESIEQRFSNIYRSNIWFENGQSKSGAGSTLEATRNLREQLPALLLKLESKVVVDIGCGDFYWMKETVLPCKYVGLDIVSSVVEENQQKYGNDVRSFIHSNAVSDELPKETDVVLCREVLFHLSFEDGLKLIENVVCSNARFFIGTHDPKVTLNRDIKSGLFRNINLELAPFNFPKPKMWIADDGVSKNRMLGVWDVSELKLRRASVIV